jgi:hypothetical protein
MARFGAVVCLVALLVLGVAALAAADTTTVVADPGSGSGLPAVYCSVGISAYDLESAPWLAVLCNSAIAIDLVNYPNGYIYADTTGDSAMLSYCTQTAVKIAGAAWTDHGDGWYSFGVEVSDFPTEGTYGCFGPPASEKWGVFPLSSSWGGSSVLIGPGAGRSLRADVTFVGLIEVDELPTPPSVRFTDEPAPNDDPPATTTTTSSSTTTTAPGTTTTTTAGTTTTTEAVVCMEIVEAVESLTGWVQIVNGALVVGMAFLVFLMSVQVVGSWRK